MVTGNQIYDFSIKTEGSELPEVSSYVKNFKNSLEYNLNLKLIKSEPFENLCVCMVYITDNSNRPLKEQKVIHLS